MGDRDERVRGILYGHFTWEEIKEVVKEERVAVIPVGAIEQHGPHLSLDTDNHIAYAIAVEAARRCPEDAVVLPLIPFGYNDEQKDFPGVIAIKSDNFINYMMDVTKSLVGHGFKRLLIVNGHGSNNSFLDIVARRTVMETEAICALVFPYLLVRDLIKGLRESKPLSHACELETSVLWYLAPEKVHIERAVPELSAPITRFHWRDMIDSAPISFTDRWSRITKTGTLGDPTVASSEKGKRVFDEMCERLAELIHEFRRREIRAAEDHH